MPPAEPLATATGVAIAAPAVPVAVAPSAATAAIPVVSTAIAITVAAVAMWWTAASGIATISVVPPTRTAAHIAAVSTTAVEAMIALVSTVPTLPASLLLRHPSGVWLRGSHCLGLFLLALLRRARAAPCQSRRRCRRSCRCLLGPAVGSRLPAATPRH